MANLFTNHDPFHIHKIVGFCVLLNFAYRFILFVWRGYSFCQVGNNDYYCSSQNEIHFDIGCVVLHGILSWSSLLLPLPQKRNFNSPMIWREFRWHSIIFATRAVVTTLMSILNWWPTSGVQKFVVKLGLIWGTCAAADLATHLNQGSQQKRTTNSMAYPEWVTPLMQQKIKLNYSMAQMSATISCLIENPTISFLSLYAIQGAALMMTLRRKNLVGTRTVHFLYQLQLCAMVLPFAIGICHHNIHFSDHFEYWIPLFLLGGLSLLAGHLRIDKGYSKWFVWGICISIWQTFMSNPACYDVLIWFHTNPVGITYVIFSHINEYQRTLRHYMPIWLGQAPITKTGSEEYPPEKPQEKQSLSKDLLESDMLAYPDRRQRFLLVFAALLGTHFRTLDVIQQYMVERSENKQ